MMDLAVDILELLIDGVTDEDGLFSVEDLGHLELEKVGGFFRNECSLGGRRSSLDGLEDDL